MRAAYFSTGCRSMQLTVDGESVGESNERNVHDTNAAGLRRIYFTFRVLAVLGFPLALTVYRIPLLCCAFLASSFPRSSLISKPADFGSSTMASRWVGNASVGDSSGRIKGPEVQPPNRPNFCTYWIVADRLLAGEYPLSSFRSDKDCRKRLNQYLDAGITHFIDLTQPGEKESYVSLLLEEARRKEITDVTYQRLPLIPPHLDPAASSHTMDDPESVIASARRRAAPLAPPEPADAAASI
jgi:hypothetical protein